MFPVVYDQMKMASLQMKASSLRYVVKQKVSLKREHLHFGYQVTCV